MRRRVPLYLTLISLSACNGDRVVQPDATPTNPTTAISDATHGAIGGNPDFFFLPPMVGNPSGSPKWDAGAFNPDLRPTVEICASAATTEAAVGTAPCTPVLPSYTATVDAGAEQYQVNWKVPSSSTIFYRVAVKVGTKVLGFADVETGANGSQLKNVSTGDFIPLVDGRTLPIKFRIERYALCEIPGDPNKPCASKSVDLSIGGTVSITLPGTTAPTGIVIPSQGTAASIAAVTVQACDDINPRAIDLRTFGPCFRVTADNGSRDAATNFVFANAATVFSCEVDAVVHAAIDAGSLAAAQEPLVTLHRLDGYGTSAQRVAALQHVPACGKGVSSAGSTLKGVLASLAHGNVRSAARQIAALVAPAPLYASMFIDLGGGGLTGDLSDFQFALPAKMEMLPGVDGQFAAAGAVLNPTVKVTDLHGDAVVGATVHFNSRDPGATAGTVVTTGPNGLAVMPWSVGLGANVLPVSGRGIASPTSDGPRDRFDPFQPIHNALGFDNALDGPEVPVGVGTLVFSTTGVTLFAETFETGADWPGLTGYWHRSTLVGTTNVAVAAGLVSLGTGDDSRGALPSPGAGAQSLWFGADAYGNYAGELTSTGALGGLSNMGDLGGTSTDVRSGLATSPEFIVPTTGGSPQVTFRSWFEIESVNPRRFDLMTLSVRDADGVTEVLRLNPGTDPSGGRPNLPFTSGGFNASPVWTTETADLSAYKGRRIQLVFAFNTGDVLYNAFRGWIVDDVALRLSSGAAASRIPLTSSHAVAGPDTQTFPVRQYQP